MRPTAGSILRSPCSRVPLPSQTPESHQAYRSHQPHQPHRLPRSCRACRHRRPRGFPQHNRRGDMRRSSEARKVPRARRTKKVSRAEGVPRPERHRPGARGARAAEAEATGRTKRGRPGGVLGALLLDMLSGEAGDSGKAERLNRLRGRNAGQHYGAVGSTPGLRGQTLDRALEQAGATGQIRLVRFEWAGPLCAGWPVGCHVCLDCLSVWPGWSEVCLVRSGGVCKSMLRSSWALPTCLRKFVRSVCPNSLTRSVWQLRLPALSEPMQPPAWAHPASVSGLCRRSDRGRLAGCP